MHPLIRRLPATLALFIPLVAIPVAAQSFTNLNFESGLRDDLSGMYTLPGWTVSPSIHGPHIGTVHVLYPSTAVPEWQPFFPPNANKYSLTMQVGLDFQTLNPPQVLVPSVAQTALVPASAQSIRFRATTPDPYSLHYIHGGPLPPRHPDVYARNKLLAWTVAVDGQAYPLHRLGEELWGMNLPSHAGQLGTLSITMNPAYKPFGLEWPVSVFDDISFSAQRIVPEPSSVALTVLALSASTLIRRHSGRFLPASLALFIALIAIPVAAQSFTNLNFESGLRDQPFGPYSLPGWTASPSFAGPHLGGNHHLWPAPAPPAWAVSSPFPQLANNYSLLMQIGIDFPDPFGNPGPLLVPSVSQTALVPVGAQSIRFRASNPDAHHLYYVQGPPFGDPEIYFPSQLLAWRLSVDGQTFPLHRLGNDFWGMNIPGLAGQVRTLSISMTPTYPLLPTLWFPEGYFDDISFSSQRIVPEPSSIALALLALSAPALIRRRSRTKGATAKWSPKR